MNKMLPQHGTNNAIIGEKATLAVLRRHRTPFLITGLADTFRDWFNIIQKFHRLALLE